MDAPYSNERAGEKEKITEVLRDAIRILCQNTVSHHTNLTVEALIGITVDDGENSIIVSINESVNAADEECYRGEEQYENTEADTSYYEPEETTMDGGGQFKDIITYGQHYNPSVPYRAVVKKETSVIQYNVGQYNNFPPSNTATSEQNTDQYFAADGSYCAPYGYQRPVNVGRGQKVVTSGPQRSRGGRQGFQSTPRKMTSSMRNVPTMKEEHGVEVDTTTGGKRRPMDTGEMDTGEVSHVTLYTCQRCGKQYNNKQSFLRHKKSHLGIVYRCDGCGKIVSRNDHLVAHRRRCPAAQQQVPLDM